MKDEGVHCLVLDVFQGLAEILMGVGGKGGNLNFGYAVMKDLGIEGIDGNLIGCNGEFFGLFTLFVVNR
ncbi:hypothetical protein, partial [Siminovitchia fortis]|uniref:hypothetical protein n=1 Tax=Siminovitchia fortis TaxID=254758 RepID=UPI0011A4066C